MTQTLRILGCRGVPARHGGFETFAEDLSHHLVANDWTVSVYCQEVGSGPITTDTWRGIEQVRVPVPGDGPVSSVLFDLRATWHARSRNDTVLTLGYNTALLSVLYGRRSNDQSRRRHFMNMDGFEWKRSKWSRSRRAWLRLNERVGARLADHLIADHPVVGQYFEQAGYGDKVSVIPYGAESVDHVEASRLSELGLSPTDRFVIIVARPEPENSILELVTAFSSQHRGVRLVVLGDYDNESPFAERVRAAASDEVDFVGAIYDRDVVRALRRHAVLYLHGHTVGGTNPSLIEAMAAGSPILAHDNEFNRQVVGDGATYFRTVGDCERAIAELLDSPDRRDRLSATARMRFDEEYQNKRILSRYQCLLSR